ncbi:MAG: hypothetical protein GX986_04850 [Firmicutes bacterium]|nr:hypothetical protein [Bacillota bacterium]
MWIGFGKADITPNLGVDLCGYGYYLDRQAESVLDPLYVRAVALRGENRNRTLLVVNCDLIGLSDAMVSAIKSAWQDELGLGSQDALILCTHTHSGPATGILRGCGELDPQYLSYAAEQIIGAGREAFESLVKVTAVSSFQGSVEGIAWNRVFDDKGPVDTAVYGLLFKRESLRPIVLVNYACHPVTLGRNAAVSADYPGRVVQALDGAGYEALCLVGFCGDIDPEINKSSWGTGTEDTINDYGRRIAEAAIDAMDSATPMSDATLNAFHLDVELPLQSLTEEILRAELDRAAALQEAQLAYSRVVNEWVASIKSKVEETEIVTVQVLRVGKTLLIGFPGEAFTELGLIIKRGLPGWQVMTLGNANCVMRYLPVKEDIEAGNYGAYGSCQIYDRLPLRAGAGEHLAEATLTAIKEYFCQSLARQ